MLYGFTARMMIKRMEKKLDGNYTRMLLAILNKSWRQRSTKQQQFVHLTPIMKIIQIRQTRHAGHCWGSKDELKSDLLLYTPSQARAMFGQPARTIHSSSVPIRDVAWKTCLEWRTIGTSSERESGRSVIAPRKDDDIYIYIYSHLQTDCFVLSELFSVARHVGSKPLQLYVRLSLRPLGQQAYLVG